MRQAFLFVRQHLGRIVLTIGLLALAIHWGMLGFVLLSVPIFALWERILP